MSSSCERARSGGRGKAGRTVTTGMCNSIRRSSTPGTGRLRTHYQMELSSLCGAHSKALEIFDSGQSNYNGKKHGLDADDN
jgi:hypothetical protein